MTKIIVLEKFSSSSNIGDVIDVKRGYARNFLVPKKKALRYSEENMASFNIIRSKAENNNVEAVKNAKMILSTIESVTFVIEKQVSGDGKLYGAISSTDIVQSFKKQKNVDVSKKCIHFDQEIKVIGEFSVRVILHPDVIANINILVKNQEV